MIKTMNRKLFCLLLSCFMIGTILYGCDQKDEDEDGKSYTGSATGYGGEVTANVTVTEDGKIGKIDVDAPKETAEIGGVAAPKVAQDIVAKQSLAVDIVSGATVTSNAVISATEAALKEAGIDTETMK